MLQTNATTKANAEKIEMPITFSSEAVDFCFFVFILFPFSKEGKKKNLGLTPRTENRINTSLTKRKQSFIDWQERVAVGCITINLLFSSGLSSLISRLCRSLHKIHSRVTVGRGISPRRERISNHALRRLNPKMASLPVWNLTNPQRIYY